MHINLRPSVKFKTRIPSLQQRSARPLPAQLQRPTAATLSREDLQREIYALLG